MKNEEQKKLLEYKGVPYELCPLGGYMTYIASLNGKSIQAFSYRSLQLFITKELKNN